VTTGAAVGMVAGLVVGAALGLVVGLLLSIRRREVLGVEARTANALLADARGALARQADERAAAWEEERRRLQGTFAELSGRALAQNAEQFLTLADQRLKQAQEAAQGDLAQRQQAIAQLLRPLGETLERYEAGLHQLEKDRQGAYEGLTTKVAELRLTQEQLQRETRNLVTALRSPQTRGRWGEVQLRRVVEMAGMVAHCDFDEQVPAAGEDARFRPDMVVHVPGGGEIVVDAKVPLDAFLRAVESEDDDRVAHFQAHARQLRSHVDQMARKEYWKHVEGSTDQMVVFVPGDALLAAAYEHDPGLQEHAMAHGILLTTPTMLVALLRTVAYGWRQESLAVHARQVQQLGSELYDRLRTMSGHLARVQRSLTSTVEAFNQAVGSFESRVLVTARRFPELGAAFDSDELALLEPVEATPRLPHTVDPGLSEASAPTNGDAPA